jgi:uncharacterized protein YdiU (UPF0061 family)
VADEIRQAAAIQSFLSGVDAKQQSAVIPRNHRVEEALEAAVKEGDDSVMERLLEVLSSPYAYSPEDIDYTTLPEPSACPYQTFCGT